MNRIQTPGNGMDKIFDLILHLGAGLGASSGLYENLGHGRLVLVEASRELVDLLAKKYSRNDAVTIKNGLISPSEHQTKFHSYSNPRLGSQLELTEDFLQKSNIRLKSKELLQSITFDELTTDINLSGDKPNLLIIELNGYEVQFLKSLRFDQLKLFKTIIVTLLSTKRYVDQSTESDLFLVLAKNGFRLNDANSNQYHFVKDENFMALCTENYSQTCIIKQLESRIQGSSETIDRLTKERDEQVYLHKKNELAHAEVIQRLTKERDEQVHGHQENKRWAESLQKQIEESKKAQQERERSQDLALKLQAKAQIDLENLRAQFQQKCTNEQNLIELIRELQVKLQAAANYYHQLQLQHPEISNDIATNNSERRRNEAINGSDAPIDAEIVKERKRRNKSKATNS